MRSDSPWTRWVALLHAGALLWAAAPAAAQVVVVVQVPEDRDVAARLGRLLDATVSERAATGDRSSAALMDEAAAWPEQHVVVIDRKDGAIHVLRPRDRTMVSRVLAADVLRDSHYAVALASAELLDWIGVLPTARGRPASQADEPATAVGTAGAPAPVLGWALGVDLELATSPGFDVSLARPSLNAELQLGRDRAPAWFAFGVRLGAPAGWDRRLEPALTDPQTDRVEYTDTAAALHAAIGFGAGRAALLAELEGGADLVQVQASGPDGERVGEHEQFAGWVGAGLGLRYALLWGVSVAAAVQGHFLIERANYRVNGAKVLQEGPVRVATRLGLIWESALLSPGR